MNEVLLALFSALGGGGLSAIVVTALKKNERVALAHMSEGARIRAELWERIKIVEEKCDDQDDELRKLLSRARASEEKYLTLLEELTAVKKSIRPDPNK